MKKFWWLLVCGVLVGSGVAEAKRKRSRNVSKVDACQVLTPQILRQAVSVPDDVTGSPSKYSPHPLCTYRWPVKDRAVREKAWQTEMMANLKAHKPMPLRPRLDNEVSLTWLAPHKSADEAAAAHAGAVAMLNKGIKSKVRGNKVEVTAQDGSALPDAHVDERAKQRSEALKRRAEKQLEKAQKLRGQKGPKNMEINIQRAYVPVEGLGDHAAYDHEHGSLLVQSGTRRFTVDVGLESGPDQEFAVAQAIARALLNQK